MHLLQLMYCKHNAPAFHPLGNINVKANKFMANMFKCKQNITEHNRICNRE